jgi:predicted RNA-binding Zn-ribbon protein involved in translation (DUF1610 family)
MSDTTASWYARKVAQMRGTPAPAPYQPRANPGMPPQQWAPQVQRVQTPVPPVQQQPQTYDGTVKQESASLTTLLDVQRATGIAQPGQGAKLNPDPCPNCGGALFYADLGKKTRGPAPAPHCFNCGYNGGLFEQGMPSSWGV